MIRIYNIFLFILIKKGKIFKPTVLPKIVSEYDQEIPQPQTADKPMASRGKVSAMNDCQV